MSSPIPGEGWGEPSSESVEQRIIIQRDGMVVVRSGKVEYGQGIRTGFAKIISEELDIAPTRIFVELGETSRVPWDMGTFGSLSTATDGQALRAAAAFARTLLIERASKLFRLPIEVLSTENGSVVAPDGRRIQYEVLTEDQPLTGVIPANLRGPRITPPAESVPFRLEGFDIVTGGARYPGDVRLPGLLRGRVLHPPVIGAHLKTLDTTEAQNLPGHVTIVRDGDFVGVVADRDEQALSALRVLQAEWSKSGIPKSSTLEVILRRDEGWEDAFSNSSLKFSAHYHVPHIAHASISPSVAVADVKEEKADLYVATQRPFPLREEIAHFLGFRLDQVNVHPQMMCGMYGRGNINDVVLEAVRLSRAVMRPVLVQWTREDEFRFSPHRPILDADVHAALDSTGRITGWRCQFVTNPHTYGPANESLVLAEMTAGRNAIPPYRVGNAKVILSVVQGEIRTGAFRSLAGAPNVFAIESFIDEMSQALRLDPILFRLRHTEDERLIRVLERVRDRSGWNRRLRKAGNGFGVACAIYNNTYIAQVAEVTVSSKGLVHLEQVWCVVDSGRLVHPDGARNQIEGGIQQAASWTLLEELQYQDGEVITSTWHDYPIATFRDAPHTIDVEFISNDKFPSTGIGEPGSVPTAAAIANAVFDACGKRVRKLPLTPQAITAAGL